MAAIYSGSLLPVGVWHRHACDGTGVAAQKQEGDVAGSGDQVDQHGHADGSQRRQVELLHQQATHEDPQTCTRNGCHTFKWKTCLVNWYTNVCVTVHVCAQLNTDLAAGLLRWWWGWTAARGTSPERLQSRPRLQSPCRRPGWCRWTRGWTGGAWSPWESLVIKNNNINIRACWPAAQTWVSCRLCVSFGALLHLIRN